MTQTEALKLALEALEDAQYFIEAELNDRMDLYKNYTNLAHKYAGEQESLRKNQESITAIKKVLTQPEQEPVAKPYAYEYGRDNGDGTYSVVIEKGDLVQTAPAVYNYERPRNPHKDWPVKELFDHAPPQRTWVGLTQVEIEDSYNADYQAQTKAIEAKLKEKNHANGNT